MRSQQEVATLPMRSRETRDPTVAAKMAAVPVNCGRAGRVTLPASELAEHDRCINRNVSKVCQKWYGFDAMRLCLVRSMPFMVYFCP